MHVFTQRMSSAQNTASTIHVRLMMVELLKTYLHDAFIVTLGFCTLVFIARFLLPGLILLWKLGRAARALNRLRPSVGASLTDLDELTTAVMHSPRLQHCWAEFRETLHPQKQVDEYGQEHVVRWRSTALADVFFTEQTLVDTPLKSEFYKHLPGILTGIGIIATFSGLIFGLMDFQVTENPQEVRLSLGVLIQSVGQAFVLSGTAIALAMLITWVEKSIVTACYRQVEALCQGVDSLFDAGAGEEYLARLVNAAEESATQSAQMKDSLVTDLKQILTELTEMQIQAAGSHNQQLSTAVVGAINESLREPLLQISTGMNTVTRDQGTAINSLLTDVLAGFTAKIDEMFGAQMRGMNEALIQTSAAIQAAASKFDQLATGIESAGQGAAESMHQRVEAMMTAMETRQQMMNDRMAEFVDQLRVNLEGSQSESAIRLQSMLAELGQSVGAMVGQLQENADHSRNQQGEQLNQLASQMGGFLSNMERTVAQSQDTTTTKLHDMLTTLGNQTGQLVTSLESRSVATLESFQENAAHTRSQQEEQLNQLASRMSGFLESMEKTVAYSQDKAAGKLQSMLTALGDQTAQLMRSLDARNVAALQAQQDTSANFARDAQEAITQLAKQLQTLQISVEASATAMRSAIADLAKNSHDHIAQMNRGADILNASSTRLGTTLESFATSMNTMDDTGKLLSESAQKLQMVTALSNQALSGHQAAQAAFAAMVEDLKGTVENASRDARLTSELVARLESAGNKVADVQMQAEHYLETVNDVLTEAHQAFANSVKSTLREGNKDFHHELGQAVSVLRGAILELGEALETVPSNG